MDFESPTYYTIHGGNGTKCIFLDLGTDGLSIQFHGEKEQTSIHLAPENLQNFHNWLSARFGMPCQTVPDEFLAIVRRVGSTVGPVFRYKGGDKIRIKRGYERLKTARAR